jgi:hypothetical protein
VLASLARSNGEGHEETLKPDGVALGLGLTVGAGYAADNKQQTKMAQCNQEAGDKRGDERKAFMKTCLSAKKETPQQAKMKACNAWKPRTRKGDEREKFMSECLKKG